MSRHAVATEDAERERARDEVDLGFLACWDDGWTFGEIAKAFGVTRNVPLGIVHRVHDADPTALNRKPTEVSNDA